MPYNLDLEYRIDGLTDQLGEITKKKMFGGVGYLMNGNMCFGIHKEYLIIRTSEEKAEELLKDENIMPFDITGRPMKGWVMVDEETFPTDQKLADWLDLAREFVVALPAKKRK